METILVERSEVREGVVTVTLNRPEKRNAINSQMSLELLEVFWDIAARPEDRVLVLTGEGGAFCSGADLTDGGSWLLPRLVGMRRAKELAFFGDFVSAADAHHLGLVNRVFPEDDIDAFVDEWAERLVAGPPLALSMTKGMLSHSFETSIEEALEDEATCQALCIGTQDTREAIKAFVEKRSPVFRGR